MTIADGTCAGARRARQNAARSSGPTVDPGASTTNATPELTPASRTSGVLHERPLDVTGIDETARRLVAVADAIDDPRVAVVVGPRRIARPEPAVAQRTVRRYPILPVAGHHVRPVHEELARLARGAVGAVGSHDPDVHEQRRGARRPELLEGVARVEEEHDGRSFGEAVPLQERDPSGAVGADEARSGTGAPPVRNQRMLDRSAVGQRSVRVNASRRSGLPKPIVTRSSSTRQRISSGSGATGTTTVPPLNRTGSTFTPVPPVRKNGAMATVMSSLRKSATDSRFTTFVCTLPCVSITPRGGPVVPEVCGSRQSSPGSLGSSIGSGTRRR